MNKYELVYDLKEHLDTYCQTYDDYIMSYGETDMIYHYIEQKDKENKRLNNIINELENELYKFYAYEGYNDEQIKDKIKELEGSGSDKE